MVSYELIRSKRKTLAIHITSGAKLVVRAPLKLSIKQIEQFISQKENWIEKKLTLVRMVNQTQAVVSFCEGETLPFLGKEYPILYGKKVSFDGTCFFIPSEDKETLKRKLILLYKELIKDIILQKVTVFANLMQVKPTSVKISSALKRWGSCTGKNSLNFSFMLAMVNEPEIDYVVVHELAHIKQHNHSKQFWDVVSLVLPDYKQRQQQLIKLQNKMSNLF